MFPGVISNPPLLESVDLTVCFIYIKVCLSNQMGHDDDDRGHATKKRLSYNFSAPAVDTGYE